MQLRSISEQTLEKVFTLVYIELRSLWESVHTCLHRSQIALRKCSHSFRSISVSFEKVFTLVYIDLRSLWESVHTRLDRSQFALRKCSHSFRSISDRFEKVFTLVYIDLSLLWESVHTRSDRSQFALRKCSHSFTLISDRCRFALRKCCIRLDNSTSGSFRFDYGSWFGVLYHANYGCTLEIGGIFKNVELLSASSNSSAIFQPIIFTFIKLHFICYHNKIVL